MVCWYKLNVLISIICNRRGRAEVLVYKIVHVLRKGACYRKQTMCESWAGLLPFVSGFKPLNICPLKNHKVNTWWAEIAGRLVLSTAFRSLTALRTSYGSPYPHSCVGKHHKDGTEQLPMALWPSGNLWMTIWELLCSSLPLRNMY